MGYIAGSYSSKKTTENYCSQYLQVAEDEQCGLWDWNLDTDKVSFSSGWKEMLGYRADELENSALRPIDLIVQAERDDFLTKIGNYLNGQASSLALEIRMRHKDGYDVETLCRLFGMKDSSKEKPARILGFQINITKRRRTEAHNESTGEILEMIALGRPASDIYDAIALMYEARHPGMRCSMLELENGRLLHGGAPSLPEAYCKAVHGLKNGPDVGSCGTSTYTGERCLVENIETDPKWAEIKQYALPHGMRCCWSEPIKNSSGRVLGAFGMYYDFPAHPDEEELGDLIAAARLAGIVMERDQDQKRIRNLAYNDELTGLASRAHLYQKLEEIIDSAEAQKSQFGLLYIDLDDFKSINDSLGHDVGDELLIEIAERLKKVGNSNFVARLSGDEFCIVVESIDDENASLFFAQSCLDVISQPIELASRKLKPACSIGIAHYPAHGLDPTELIKTADTALYAAKESGKNQCVLYQPELTEKAEYAFQVEQALREAIQNQQLTLAYQPQINLDSGEIVGFEALSRWHHETLGVITPTEFIPITERIGMIKPLTEWVMRTACKQLVTWQSSGFRPVKIAVNVPANLFLDREIVILLKEVIAETGIKPEQLELEVTETAAQTAPANKEIFQEIRQMGVMLSIDDFGIGYSSFSSLKHLPVDCLKIDKYFVKDMIADEQSKILVESMIDVGQKMGHVIIAEGVETEQQLAVLKDLGYRIGQGYLFSEAVSAEEVEVLLGKG